MGTDPGEVKVEVAIFTAGGIIICSQLLAFSCQRLLIFSDGWQLLSDSLKLHLDNFLIRDDSIFFISVMNELASSYSSGDKYSRSLDNRIRYSTSDAEPIAI